MSHVIQVLLPIPIDHPFSYEAPEDVSFAPGDLVVVPFRRGTTTGIVWPTKHEISFSGDLKKIYRKLDSLSLPQESLDFITWVSSYTLSPLGLVAKMVLPIDLHDPLKSKKQIASQSPVLGRHHVVLTTEQQHAADRIREDIKKNTFKPFLLDGVTGSGKTEVYLSAIEEALHQSKQSLILLPEIALTSQWLHRFERRFEYQPLQWHSGLTPLQRRLTWEHVVSGKASVIVGARSALFLPFPKLGLIIVDEEHDPSFKQEEQVIYHARDMAVVRAKLSSCPLILASATPSIETVQNAQSGRYTHLTLKSRHGKAVLPSIQIIDMRSHPQQWISPPLQQALQETLSASEQAILFINRRGYAPLNLCKTCGHRLMCPACTAWLVEHKRFQKLQCHYCGYSQSLPEQCPSCLNKETFIPCGPGVERIHETLQKLFPTARCDIFTSDTANTPKKIHEFVKKIVNHETDIIVGTQMIAKGHHFPLITLVGIIDADVGLNGGDLRASERTYQLLHQVAGRAGREERPGRVFLQSFCPEHPLIQSLQKHHRDDFLALEISQRELASMPPFGRLVGIIISGLKLDQVENTAKLLMRSAPHHPQIRILGPVPAPLSLLRGRHRWRILVKAEKHVPIQIILKEWLSKITPVGTVKITIDIDPHSFL